MSRKKQRKKKNREKKKNSKSLRMRMTMLRLSSKFNDLQLYSYIFLGVIAVGVINL